LDMAADAYNQVPESTWMVYPSAGSWGKH
jgi:hypothetical protein